MHKSMTPHIINVKDLNFSVIDIPEILLSVLEENEKLYDYIIAVVDYVYAPMITNKCLNLIDILDLHYINSRLKNDIVDLNKIKIIGVEHYLNEKINKILDYSNNNEIYEVIHNLNLFKKITDQLNKIDFI